MRRAVEGYLENTARDVSSPVVDLQLELITPHTSLAPSSVRKADAAILERDRLFINNN